MTRFHFEKTSRKLAMACSCAALRTTRASSIAHVSSCCTACTILSSEVTSGCVRYECMNSIELDSEVTFVLAPTTLKYW